MRLFLSIIAGFTLAATCASADEAEDRAAISRVVAALNAVPLSDALFTSDADGKILIRIMQRGGSPEIVRVVISHEPWGEAQILLPGELGLARVETRTVRFVTPDVALVDASFGPLPGEHGDLLYPPGVSQTTTLLLVMKKTVEWRIASVRILATDQVRPAAR